MLEYKLKRYGIRFIKQEESYTSQCSPLSPKVEKRYAEPSKRKERGLYRDGNRTYNADAVGAYNILRKYHSVSGVKRELSVTGLKTPEGQGFAMLSIVVAVALVLQIYFLRPKTDNMVD